MSDLKKTNYLVELCVLTGQFDTIMDICETNSDKCMSKTTMPLLKYVILNISDSANLFC